MKRGSRRERVFAGAGYAVALAFALTIATRTAQGSETNVLTTASQVGRLSVERAKREYPVVLRGVVTYAAVKLGLVFVYDRTGGAFVYFDYTPSIPELHTGQIVEVHGITTPGDFSPCLKKGTFKVLGEGALPVPKRRGFEQLVTGRWVCDWVEVEGTVRSGKAVPGNIQLSLAVENGTILVIMQQFPNWKQVLIGARVRMRGAVSALYNDRRQSRGVKLFVPGARYISIEKPAPADPFSIPPESLSSIGQFNLSSDLESQMRVTGTVTAVDGTRIYLSNGDTNIAVQASAECSPKSGDDLSVVGFRELVDHRPGLVDVICRGTAGKRAVRPVAVSAQQILSFRPSPTGDPTVFLHTSTHYDLQLVRIEGTLLQSRSGPDGLTLILSSQGRDFTALLPALAAHFANEQRAGSVLSLTGVCVITYDSYSTPQGFRIIVPSASSIQVVSESPWWTADRLWGLCSAALVAGFIALGWIVMLRARVEERTRALKKANADLVRLASVDGLTKIANRRKFDQTLENEWSQMLRTGSPLSLILLDIDYFKLLNDALGHQRGDECLVRIASELHSRQSREMDLVARFGGEEFAFILPATDEVGAKQFAETIRLGIAQLRITHPVSPIGAIVTVSLGVATARAGKPDVVTELVAGADKALYEAKHLGRDRVVCWDVSGANAMGSTERASDDATETVSRTWFP